MQRFCKLITICISFLFILFISCKNNINRNDITYSLPDTLKIGTIYSPTTFFIFRGDTLGYEYERILNFTSSNNITAEFIIYNNLSEMIEMLDSGKIDIIAYEVPIINEYKNIVLHCGTENITNQVLVQQKNKDLILNVTHAIQQKGLEKVADIYDEVNITNSYKDWQDEELPININVLKYY